PTKDENKSTLEKQLAIPYMGNNTPNERCKFGNRFESINYTIQLQYNLGFSFELFEQVISDLLEETRVELIQDPGKLFEETTAYIEFEKLFRGHGDYKLIDFNPKNKDDFQEKYETLRKHEKFISYCLREHVLRTLKIESQSLEQNASNHVNL